jgi:hypothetical protein
MSRRPLSGLIQVSEHDRSAANGRGARGHLPDRIGDDAERGYLHPANVAKAQRKMQDYLTFFRQNAARERANGDDNGWELAIATSER